MINNRSVITALTVFLILSTLLPLSAAAQFVIALDEQLDEYWTEEKMVAPRYPRMALRRGIMGCAAVGYVIKADGSTDEHIILAYYPSDVFNKSAIKAAKQFSYKPSEQNSARASIITLNVFTYHLSDDQHGGDEKGEERQELLDEMCSKAGKKALVADGAQANES